MLICYNQLAMGLDHGHLDEPPRPLEGWPHADPTTLVDINGIRIPRSLLVKFRDMDVGSGRGLISIANKFRAQAIKILEEHEKSGQEDLMAIEQAREELNAMPNVPCYIERKSFDKWEFRLGIKRIDLDGESITLALANDLPPTPPSNTPSNN